MSELPALTEADKQSCVDGSRQTLGKAAEVLRCGHLTGRSSLEAVAVLRLSKLKEDQYGTPLSKLVIIQKEKSYWSTELTVANQIKNGAGYLAAEFIDDSSPISWFRVRFFGEGSKDFGLDLKYVIPPGITDEGGLPAEIGWNPSVGRYQEVELGGERYVGEKATLPHIRTKKNCNAGPC